MRLIRYPVGEMQANCYFLIEGNNCIIIDAGESADFLLEQIQIKKLKPLAIFASHGHFDHIMAVGEIQLSFDIPFYIAKEDLFLVKRVSETARYFLKQKIAIIDPKNIQDIKVGELKIENFKLKILKTPGHTPGASCFYLKDQGWLFTGDTLFKDAIGRYDFSYSDKQKLKLSLERLFKLPDETIIYPGHGEETIIDEERKNRLI